MSYKLFEVSNWTLAEFAVIVTLVKDGKPKRLHLSRANYEQWLEKMDRLYYFHEHSGEPYKCAVADYWNAVHASFVARDLYEYIAARHFLHDGCAYNATQNSTPEIRQQQSVKQLCHEVRDLLANTIVVVNELEDATPAAQHNDAARLELLSKDIQTLAAQLVKASRSNTGALGDMIVHANGTIDPYPQSE